MKITALFALVLSAAAWAEAPPKLTPLLAVPDKVAVQDDFSEDGPLEKKRGKKRK